MSQVLLMLTSINSIQTTEGRVVGLRRIPRAQYNSHILSHRLLFCLHFFHGSCILTLPCHVLKEDEAFCEENLSHSHDFFYHVKNWKKILRFSGPHIL